MVLDVPGEKGGAGAPEITPEMLSAGARIIADEYGVLGSYEAEGLARDVFTAMLHAAMTPDPRQDTSAADEAAQSPLQR
jgi:hypothetical protein